MTSPHRIILCGRTEAIGAVVIENLKPEFESTSRHHPQTTSKLTPAAIEFVQTVNVGKTLIPALLRGDKPDDGIALSKLGTKDYSKTPVAVILGAAFDDHGIGELREAAKMEGARDVLWLRPDTSKATPPPGPLYGKAMVERIKERVKELEERGELGNGGVVWF